MKKIYSLFILFLCLYINNLSAKATKDSLQSIKKTFSTNKIVKNNKPSEYHKDAFSLFTGNDPETDKEIGKAIGSFDELEKSGNFSNTINPNELTEFPIGIRENVSNVEYGIVVTKAKFTPEYAIINVYARIVTPQAGAEGGKKTLYFGAEGVKLSYNGKIIGDAKLSLLGDINMPFNQNQWMLTLEGGKINKINGESYNDNTYVVIDCDGIKELSLKGSVQISREVLVPLKENGEMADSTVTINGKSVTNRVRGDFAIKASDWNDLLVKVNITPFAITKQTQDKDKGYFSFFVNNAVLDLSDLRTDASVVFPQYYATHGYLIGGTETWRGLYVESLYVGLPQEFKTEDHVDNRVSFEAQNLLIDSYGVSGSFTANNVFPLEKGVTSEQNAWRYSLDKIGVNLAASKIVGANIAGRIQLPIQRPENENTQQVSETTPETQSATQNQSTTLPTLPKNKYSLAYRGLITEAEYLLQVETEENISFDIWSAEAIIASGSSVELRVKNREFLPKANLSGVMSVYANASPQDKDIVEKSKRDANFKGVIFQELVLQTKAPFVTTKYFGVKGEQKLAGFPASIKNIFVEADNGYANLGFEVTVGLQEERFSASGGMKINGLIVSENNRQRWKYNGFTLTKLELRNVDIGIATVSGSLQIMRKDPLYGNGFMASLSAKDIKGLKNAVISVNAAFGYSTFRYWGFDGSIDGLKIPAGLVDITGFTGGAFYHMIPDRDMSMLHKDRPLVMKPDNTISLALRAGVYGVVKDKSVASFMAGFNISTNPNGGLANIGFVGEALIMSDITAIAPAPFAKVQEKFREMTGKSKFLNDLKSDSHVNSFLDVNQVDENYPLEVTIPSKIYGKLAMNYDFNNSVFHANLDVYVNTPGGVIKGIGPNGRAGWAVLHIAPDDWYLHIGTPSDMIGLRVGFGNFYLQSGSYFMVGNHIPGSPPPPVEVAQILGLQLNDIDYMKDLNALGDGKGFAFGTHIKFDTGDMTALFLYADFKQV